MRSVKLITIVRRTVGLNNERTVEVVTKVNVQLADLKVRRAVKVGQHLTVEVDE